MIHALKSIPSQIFNVETINASQYRAESTWSVSEGVWFQICLCDARGVDSSYHVRTNVSVGRGLI